MVKIQMVLKNQAPCQKMSNTSNLILKPYTKGEKKRALLFYLSLPSLFFLTTIKEPISETDASIAMKVTPMLYICRVLDSDPSDSQSVSSPVSES